MLAGEGADSCSSHHSDPAAKHPANLGRCCCLHAACPIGLLGLQEQKALCSPSAYSMGINEVTCVHYAASVHCVVFVERNMPCHQMWGESQTCQSNIFYSRLTYFIGSSNYRIPWVGKDLKDHVVPTPCRRQGCYPPDQAAQGPIQAGLEHL